MASLVENSEESLPLSAIAQYQAAFLQGRVRPEGKAVDDTTDADATNNATALNVATANGMAAGATEDRDGGSKGEGDVVIAQQGSTNEEGDAMPLGSAQAYRTPISSPKTNDAPKPIPRLESTKSAPPPDMAAMIDGSPMRGPEDMMRAKSVDGDFSGDTQPFDDEVYSKWEESVALSKSMKAQTPKKEKVILEISPRLENTYDTQGPGETPRTLQKGDDGFVDLNAELESDAGSPRPGSELGDSINGESQREQLPGLDGVFKRPDLPETPALAGHKRKRSSQVPSSEPSTKKTVALYDAFGFGIAQTMTESQMFAYTQQRSSPMPEAPWSNNAAQTRPSPNFTNQFTVSSPMIGKSSPIFQRAPPSTAGEPRSRYITAKESQERKTRQLEEDFNLPRRSLGDTQESEEGTQERRAQLQRLKRNVSDQNLRFFGAGSLRPSSRSRPTTSSSPVKGPVIDLRTPAAPRQMTEEDFDSPAGLEDDEEPIVEDDQMVDVEPDDEPIADAGSDDDEPIVEDEQIADAGSDDDGESVNDVYDEFAQEVIRSQGPEPDDEATDDDDEGTRDQDEEAEVDETVDEELAAEVDDEAAEVPDPPRTLVQGSSQFERRDLQRKSQQGTQHSAIPDSQTLRNQLPPASASPQGSGPSPTCSHVPGSQHVGRTSLDQTSIPSKLTNGPMRPPTLSASKSEEAAQQVVPSSPPVAGPNNATEDYTAEASWKRKEMLEQLEAAPQEDEREIPESDVRAPNDYSSRPMTAEDRPNTASNNAPFSTARSHLSAALSPIKARASQQSATNYSQSPRTKAGVRHFADLAGPPAPAPAGSAEDALADLDAVMSDFINAEDQEFLDATSDLAPELPRKRRRTDAKAKVRSSSPVKKVRMETEVEVPVERDLQEESNVIAASVESDGARTRALRDSPSKANEQRVASPPVEYTPDSVKQREYAGARAASQLVAKRSSKLTKPTRVYGGARKTGSKLQNAATLDEDDATPKEARRSKRASKSDEVQPQEEPVDAETESTNTEEPEIEETVVETGEDDGASAEPRPEAEDTAVVAPLRMFALFKGNFNAFYPATWLGVSNTGGHRIKFDDTTVTSIEPHLTARLEFALGDQVKVDRPGMKNKVWIVKGFGPALPADKAQQAYTDVHGHETIKVQVKSTRNSVSGPNAVLVGEGDVLEMPIEAVYLPHSLWRHFSRPEFQPGVQHGAKSRMETPSTGAQTPVNGETPPSRSRRTTASTVKALEKRGSSLKAESAVVATPSNDGLFSGMAFAVSYGPNESERANLTRHIQRNGGVILEEGFTGLFENPDLEKAAGTANHARLQLRPEHRHHGFVALVADKHSRRAKYFQALALGIPTLSGRWITDSLDTAKNHSLNGAQPAPLAWTKYLLAAGDSAYLGGAVRSRELPAYAPETARLEDTVANRPRILSGEGVLIVGSKKNKAVWERRKAFAFLTVALGAGCVRRVGDLQEAKTLAERDPEKWRFVYVEGAFANGAYVDGSVAEAGQVLFGSRKRRFVAVDELGGDAGQAVSGNKKRKREGKGEGKLVAASDGTLSVVNDEFVIQSMILGALLD